MLKSKLDNINGFTLIELLLVIGLIAIILSTVNPYFSNLPSSAKEKVDKTNAKLLIQEVYANILLEEIVIDISNKENITEVVKDNSIFIPTSSVTGHEFQVFVSEMNNSKKSKYLIEISNGIVIIESKEL